MERKAFRRLSEIRLPDRLDLLAEGLELICEHVRALREDITCLDGERRLRSASILGGIADEEAAKALIVLDIFRDTGTDNQAMAVQLRRMSNHLARCIYAETTYLRPFTFADARKHVDRARESHYLDGPMDYDWIFSNELLTQREGHMYVDFVWDPDADHGAWTTPAHLDGGVGPLTSVLDLVVSLEQTGCLRRRSLDVIADEWRVSALTEETTRREVSELNARVLERLYDEHEFAETATQDDVDRVIERWGFPLTRLELDEIKISREALRLQQERYLAAEHYDDYYGEYW